MPGQTHYWFKGLNWEKVLAKVRAISCEEPQMQCIETQGNCSHCVGSDRDTGAGRDHGIAPMGSGREMSGISYDDRAHDLDNRDTRVTGVRAQGYTMPWVPDDDKALAASGGGESARGAAHLLADCGWLRFPYVQYRFLFISIA